ncbi:PKHD-type hydroxylase [Endobacter medicaginis]|uniref:Fe2+-dependent dioxygenase n=1 Tax=Endobacter medicaginis TaxID=1181271 RepID=A0A839UXE4_9PROT|nr:Fe2+-dependent dioxygenase [Endobacter medicaginis]MBB3173034.1 PKHD-type hydroxylase [Endobacter medicaginis]MCX5474541.1 Fe2+-dependent dioxygenase [Endobacter medicaginis]NVN31095.1 Fe2+-dependent dioxygenase [Endobacter medicaginis]
MLVVLDDIIEADALGAMRARLRRDAHWLDGRMTAGHQSARVKRNRQLAEDDPVALELSAEIGAALHRSPRFVSAALPQRISPLLFNSYGPGQTFGAHVDNAIRMTGRGTLRTDLSATLMLDDDFEGGALVIEDVFGPREIRLRAGQMVLYPSSSLHRVEPVQRGERLVAVFWLQSLIRDDAQRRILFELDHSIQALGGELDPLHAQVVALTAIYHNLVRRWAEP